MRYFKNGRRVSTKPSLAELHHFYTGGILALVCFWFGFEAYLPQWLLTVLFSMGCFGLWVALDDLIQHYIQIKQWKAIGSYCKYSFWNWFPLKILGKFP